MGRRGLYASTTSKNTHASSVPTENSMFDISVHWTLCCHSSCDIPLSVVAGKGLRSAVPFSLPCPLGNKTCSHSQCWYVCIPNDLFDSNSCRCGKLVRERERNVLFNDALNTFYLRLYGVRHMVKDHSDSEKGHPLPPHRLLLSINSKGSFICTFPQTG